MTLRFFRRKSSGETNDAAQDMAANQISEESQDEKKPARRRRGRGGSGSSSLSTSSAKAAAEEKTAATATEGSTSSTKSSGGRRRGRRGGASRRPATKPAEAQAEPTAPTPAARLKGEPEALEGLLAQQQTALQELAAQQISTLKGLQGSLSAIENRLAGGGERPSHLADRPRVGIFVDVPNVMYAAERERVKLDFGKVLEFIIGNRELVRASAYAPISDDPEEKLETQKFVEPFVDLGYRIVTKPLKRYANGSIKANFDVELAIDVLTMSDRLDIVVLVSGDGDFRRLVELVESKGVRVEVVAFGQSTAAELRAVADDYTDLNDHLKELCVKR